MKRYSLLFACVAYLGVGSVFVAAVSAAEHPQGAQVAVERAGASVIPALVRIHVVEVDYRSGREIKSEATGSGVIFTKEGHVITNHHVAGNAKQIICTLATKDDIDAELVGTDPLTDICVIRLQPEKPREFPVAQFGDSSLLQVGDGVLAMGSPLALSQSVTMGIVSNTELVIPDLFWPFKLQLEGEDVGSIVRWIGHDAEVNPGNSGGPLVNLRGEVIGINEMQFGLSAAIPGNLARQVAEELIRSGKVIRAWIGLEVQPLLRSWRDGNGVLVSGTIPESPAEQGGFQGGDLLTSLAGQEVSVSVPEELPIFNQMVAGLPVGKAAEAVVQRSGNEVVLQVIPRERETAEPKARELSEWGLAARNLSLLAAKELRRESQRGVLVDSVRPGGPCDQAKPRIVEGAVISEVAGELVASVEELAALTARLLEGKEEPTPVLVAFERKGEKYLTAVNVGKERPSEPAVEVRKAWLPVATQVLTRELAEALDLVGRTGVRVTQVYPGHSAERAGLQVGDIVVALDGETIPASRPEHLDVLPAMIRQRPIGSEAELTFIRGEQELRLTVTLEESAATAREMTKHRDDSFEFTVRDITFDDRVRQQWAGDQQGALVDVVSEGGWAALGHLAVGDLILGVDGSPTPDATSLADKMAAVAREKPQAVVFRVQRGIHHLFIELRPKWPK